MYGIFSVLNAYGNFFGMSMEFELCMRKFLLSYTCQGVLKQYSLIVSLIVLLDIIIISF